MYGDNVTNMVISCEYDSGCFHNEFYLPNDPVISCYGQGTNRYFDKYQKLMIHMIICVLEKDAKTWDIYISHNRQVM